MKKTGMDGRHLARGRWSATALAAMLVVACGGGGESGSDVSNDAAVAKLAPASA